MPQKTSIDDSTIKIIETALTELRTNPKYGVDSDEAPQGKSNIYNTFVDVIIRSQDAETVKALYEKVKSETDRDVKVFGDDQHVAMAILNLDRSIAVELFLPSRGSFDWSKTDWISKKAELEAFQKHVERVISKHFNYRIFHDRPAQASK